MKTYEIRSENDEVIFAVITSPETKQEVMQGFIDSLTIVDVTDEL